MILWQMSNKIKKKIKFFHKIICMNDKMAIFAS